MRHHDQKKVSEQLKSIAKHQFTQMESLEKEIEASLMPAETLGSTFGPDASFADNSKLGASHIASDRERNIKTQKDWMAWTSATPPL